MNICQTGTHYVVYREDSANGVYIIGHFITEDYAKTFCDEAQAAVDNLCNIIEQDEDMSDDEIETLMKQNHYDPTLMWEGQEYIEYSYAECIDLGYK